MDKYEYYNKYCDLLKQAEEKEAKLEVLIQKWLAGEGDVNSNIMNRLITSVDEQITKIRDEAQNCKLEYERLFEEEQLQEQKETYAKESEMRLRYQLGIEISKMVIDGGILSSNSSESQLLGRDKTPEELEMDKEIVMNVLREKVSKKEIDLAQASQLKSDIEAYYGKSNEEPTQRRI